MFIPLCVAAAAAASVDSMPPNVFFLLTDDQDVMLGGLDPMPQLKSLITDQGVEMLKAYVHTPICCPSRSSYLTGRYLHNSLTFENDIAHGCSNETWAAEPEKRTYAVHAKAAGYHTHYSGKYLNQYALPGSPGCVKKNEPGCFRVPPGWDDWHGLQGNSRYYNGTISNNGNATKHGDKPEDYLPNIFFGHTKAFLEEHLAKESKQGIPFLAVLATPSCHGPFTPDPKYIGHFANRSAPRTPNWNASTEGKQWLMRQQAPISENVAKGIDHVHNSRWETLLSVDDYVGEIVSMLKAAGQLDNTYFLFTSDHGFQLGQHRLPGDKRHLYEHDVRIPMVMRGPGIKAGTKLDKAVLNVDVAPTIVDIMTGSVPDDMDGRSFKPLLLGTGDEDTWRTDFMVSYFGQGREPCGLQVCPPPKPDRFHVNDAYNNTYSCVRSGFDGSASDTMYCEFDDDENFIEYYEHDTDPWQLHNLYPAQEGKFGPLKAKLELFRKCKGVACRAL